MDTTRLAMSGDNIAASVMLALCLINGMSLTAWLFTWLNMRWPTRNAADDRHHRGARVVYRDDE
jgi:hypothetical protein